MIDVFGVIEKFVGVVRFQTPLTPVSVHVVPAPRLTDRTLELLEENELQLTFPVTIRVPMVSVNVLPPVAKLSTVYVPNGATIETVLFSVRADDVKVSDERPVNVIAPWEAGIVSPGINVSDPKTEMPTVRDNIGVPVVPVKSMLRPSLGMSAVTVLPAIKALLITTSSCGSGTRLVHPCVDQAKEAVPVAVCVADTVAFVVTAPALPKQSPMNALPALVQEAAPE